MFLTEWREFPSAPCLARKKNFITARVSMLLKSRAFRTCFRACLLPGRVKDLSAPRYRVLIENLNTSLLTPWCRVLLEQLTASQLVKKFPAFMQPEGSFPHSQMPATCPYPEPSRSSPCTHTPLPEDLSQFPGRCCCK